MMMVIMIVYVYDIHFLMRLDQWWGHGTEIREGCKYRGNGEEDMTADYKEYQLYIHERMT